jgi:hypothetical protein
LSSEFMTLPEVAAHFRKGKRWMREFLNLHPHYKLAGRTMLFSELHIAKLWEAMERPPNHLRPRKSAPAVKQILREMRATAKPNEASRR